MRTAKAAVVHQTGGQFVIEVYDDMLAGRINRGVLML